MTRVPQKFCTYKECKLPHLSKGLCAHHYDRSRKGRDMDAPMVGIELFPICEADECDWLVVRPGKRYCPTHGARKYRGKNPTSKAVNSRVLKWRECSVEGCNQVVESKRGHGSKHCPVHMNQIRRGVEPGIYRTPNGFYTDCLVPGCEKGPRVVGLCMAHYVRRNKYSLTTEELIEVLGRDCAICGDSQKIHIDHDHSCCPGEESCGKCVRGALCSPCNLGLGAFRDSPEKLESAIRYLRETSMC